MMLQACHISAQSAPATTSCAAESCFGFALTLRQGQCGKGPGDPGAARIARPPLAGLSNAAARHPPCGLHGTCSCRAHAYLPAAAGIEWPWQWLCTCSTQWSARAGPARCSLQFGPARWQQAEAGARAERGSSTPKGPAEHPSRHFDSNHGARRPVRCARARLGACSHTHTHAHARMHTSTHMHTNTDMCARAHTYMHSHTCAHACMCA